MIPGMYVVRHGAPVRVERMDPEHAGGSTVAARPRTRYVLADLARDTTETLLDPMATDVPLLPACDTPDGCGAQAGFPCVQGPSYFTDMATRAARSTTDD